MVRLLTESALPTAGALEHLGTALVARSHQGIVGSAMLEIYDDGALLRSVAVAPAARNRGLGAQLTESALRLAETLEVPAVYLLTTTAEQFFRKFAFLPILREDVPAGVQGSVEFRSACPASALVMRRSLG